MAKFRDNVETGQGGQFLKLKDKESQYVIFLGDPYEFFQTFDQAKMKATVVPEGTPKAAFRFRMNAVIKNADGKYEARIFENGATVYNMLKTLNQEYGGLDTVIVKITRQGTGLETEYQLVPLRQEIPPATKAQLAKLKLLKLEHEAPVPMPTEHEHGFSDAPPPDHFDQSHDELPF